MNGQEDPNILVYQALDQVLSERTVAPGTPRALFQAIDQLRLGSGPGDQVRRVENVAIEVHRFQNSLQRSDTTECLAIIGRLQELAISWMDSRIRSQLC